MTRSVNTNLASHQSFTACAALIRCSECFNVAEFSAAAAGSACSE